MKKMIALAALALVLASGTAAVLTVDPQPALACPSPTCFSGYELFGQAPHHVSRQGSASCVEHR
jgi:hypothetical protein